MHPRRRMMETGEHFPSGWQDSAPADDWDDEAEPQDDPWADDPPVPGWEDDAPYEPAPEDGTRRAARRCSSPSLPRSALH